MLLQCLTPTEKADRSASQLLSKSNQSIWQAWKRVGIRSTSFGQHADIELNVSIENCHLTNSITGFVATLALHSKQRITTSSTSISLRSTYQFCVDKRDTARMYIFYNIFRSVGCKPFIHLPSFANTILNLCNEIFDLPTFQTTSQHKKCHFQSIFKFIFVIRKSTLS